MSDPLLTPSRQVVVREDWLAQASEEILDPGLPIIDPHHHLWDHPGEHYFLDDLLRDTATGMTSGRPSSCNAAPCIAPRGRRSAARWARPNSSPAPRRRARAGNYGKVRACAGIIGMVDLTLGDRVTPLLEAHIGIAQERFRGVRNRTAWHPSPRSAPTWSRRHRGRWSTRLRHRGEAAGGDGPDPGCLGLSHRNFRR